MRLKQRAAICSIGSLGKTQGCCHNFMRLINFLSCEGESSKQRLTVLVYAFIGLKLRECVSLFNCFEITNEEIQELAKKSQEYFRANALFLPNSVNPTMWTSGNTVPAHCKEAFQRYGQEFISKEEV